MTQPPQPAAAAADEAPQRQLLTIGLTGGVGSGKSTVAAMFAERGAKLIDTDTIAREVVAPGEPGLAAVRAAFGDSVLARLAKVDGPYAVVAVPLLVETDFRKLVDRVLVVDCPESLQLERLMCRDGIPRPDALAMLAAQVDRATRLKAADDVLDNGGDLRTTRRRVADLHERYLELARRKAKSG
jgi:dephospho-CoA kinase